MRFVEISSLRSILYHTLHELSTHFKKNNIKEKLSKISDKTRRKTKGKGWIEDRKYGTIIFLPVPDRSVKQRNDEEVRNGQTGRISITDVQVPFRIFQD